MAQSAERKETTTQVPWKGKELRHFWALVRKNGLNAEFVANMTEQRSKKSIKDLTRSEWCEILTTLERRSDPEYGCSDEQWARIKWLQHEVGWTDKHLENYIKKYGHIDRIEWLCSTIAQKIMVAMEKIRGYVPKGLRR